MIEAGILISALAIVIATLCVFKVIGIPLNLNALGEASEYLIHTEAINEAKKWRMKKIDEAERKGKKVLLTKVGEFGEGMLDTVEYALNRGFSVTVVSGNQTWCDTKNKVINFLTNEKFSERFKYYVLDQRPQDHFAIIGQSHLFIEDPHEYDAKIKPSLGVTNAHKHILNRFNITFENAKKMAKEPNVDFVKNMPCYVPQINTQK